MSNDHNVTLTPVGQGSQLVWEMEYKGEKGNGPNTYPKIKVGKGDKDVKIEFTINGSNDITFVPKNQKPMYIQETDPANPKKPAKGVVNHNFDDQIVSQDGKTLTVKDKNGGAKTYSYELNFNNNVKSLDPIIENGGGGNNFYDFIQNHPVDAGILAILLLTVLFALVRDKMALK